MSQSTGKNADVHLSGYQARDLEVIDYEMTELGDTGLMFRGPMPEGLASGDYFSAIGAAQTLGCFTDHAYPKLLADELGTSALNLGYGGAGPEFFSGHDELIEYINRGKFLIVQAMSGRSQSNSVFETGGLEYVTRKSDGKKMGAAEAWRELLLGNPALRKLPLGGAIARRLALPRLKTVLNETRKGWIESSRTLFEKVTVPTIFVWFSKRTPVYPESLVTQHRLFGEFPHMINAEVLDAVKPMTDHYVECVSERGSPQPLFSRHTGEPITVNPHQDRPDLAMGEPWTHNIYYPSPEMHEDVSGLLLPVCREVMAQI